MGKVADFPRRTKQRKHAQSCVNMSRHSILTRLQPCNLYYIRRRHKPKGYTHSHKMAYTSKLRHTGYCRYEEIGHTMATSSPHCKARHICMTGTMPLLTTETTTVYSNTCRKALRKFRNPISNSTCVLYSHFHYVCLEFGSNARVAEADLRYLSDSASLPTGST